MSLNHYFQCDETSDKKILDSQLKTYCCSVFFDASSFSALLTESSERDNEYFTASDQIQDIEWIDGPDMNWVTS